MYVRTLQMHGTIVSVILGSHQAQVCKYFNRHPIFSAYVFPNDSEGYVTVRVPVPAMGHYQDYALQFRSNHTEQKFELSFNVGFGTITWSKMKDRRQGSSWMVSNTHALTLFLPLTKHFI